jgi:hypothetical protein
MVWPEILMQEITYDSKEEQPMRSHHPALGLSCDDPSYPSRDLQQSCWGATVNCRIVSFDHQTCCLLSHLMMGQILSIEQINQKYVN